MSSQVAIQTELKSLPNSGAKGSSIIVVDDNPNNLKLLEGMLHDCGFVVRLFPGGKMALAAASANPPDLILLDIMMPEMNGYEVCKNLKSNSNLAEIPVIFLSAINDTIDKVKAFQVGAIDYITKPFQIEEVRARIETHLEIRRQKRLLQENYAKLQQLEALRDNLIHMIVHDMRTPLTIINGVHELLERFEGEKLSPEGLQRLQSAMKRTDDLIGLVNSLLDISKLESGKMNLKTSNFDLGTLIGKIASKYINYPTKHVITPVLPEKIINISGDESLISRVIQNLINNAIKYSPEAKDIRVGLLSTDDSVRVFVEDKGQGIPAEYHQKIFDKFYQIDGKMNSSGLGLTFCKLVVEAHHGRIGVDSEVGQGSRFWFVMPRQPQR